MSYPSIDATDDIILCAACGKKEDEDNNLKACTACKMVKYCNRDCQIAHRRQHKKACKKRAAAVQEEALFEQPPPNEDCPVCFLHCRHSESSGINHVVGKRCATDVWMQFMIEHPVTRFQCAPFAGHRYIQQMKKVSKD